MTAESTDPRPDAPAAEPLALRLNDQLGQRPKRDVVGLLRGLERHGEDNIWRTAQEAREEIEELRGGLRGMVTLLETLRTKGESRYCYVESRAGQMVHVADAIESARALLMMA